MKVYLLVIFILCINTLSALANPVDSLVINFANKTKMIIFSFNKKDIQALSKYDLNKIIQEMSIKLDSVPNGRTYVIDEKSGQQYLKDTLLMINKKDNDINITMQTAGTSETDTSKASTYKRVKNHVNSANMKIKTDFHIGLNNWISQGTSLLYPNNISELRPLGSRYFAVSLYRNPALIKGKAVRVSIRYGLELAWNNYMFEENIRLGKGISAVDFNPVVESLKKSKLTVATVQLPVVPQISFYDSDGHKTFHLGVGGFVGYRIDSYTKVKYQNNDKNRDHSNLYLNDLQYGLMATIGLLKTDLFVKYNLNSVFKINQGPELRTISFGISL